MHHIYGSYGLAGPICIMHYDKLCPVSVCAKGVHSFAHTVAHLFFPPFRMCLLFFDCFRLCFFLFVHASSCIHGVRPARVYGLGMA